VFSECVARRVFRGQTRRGVAADETEVVMRRRRETRVGMKGGTKKFHTGRHHLPYIPTKYQILKKDSKSEKIQEIPAKSGTESVGHFS